MPTTQQYEAQEMQIAYIYKAQRWFIYTYSTELTNNICRNKKM